eukprot:gene12784-7056_t
MLNKRTSEFKPRENNQKRNEFIDVTPYLKLGNKVYEDLKDDDDVLEVLKKFEKLAKHKNIDLGFGCDNGDYEGEKEALDEMTMHEQRKFVQDVADTIHHCSKDEIKGGESSDEE